MKKETLFLKSFGQHLASLRKQHKLSQEKFADLSGKMINTVSNIERGLSDPKISTLFSFANVLHISIDQLFYPVEKNGHAARIDEIVQLLKTADDKTLKIIQKQIKALMDVK